VNPTDGASTPEPAPDEGVPSEATDAEVADEALAEERAGQSPLRSQAGYVVLLARWAAAHVAIARIQFFWWVKWALALAGLASAAGTLAVEPDWPMLVFAAALLTAAIGVAVAGWAAVRLLRRLSLSRRARPLAAELQASRQRLLDEVAAAGVPVGLWAAVRFVVALALGRRPQSGVLTNLRAVAGRLDEIVDRDQLRRALDDAT